MTIVDRTPSGLQLPGEPSPQTDGSWRRTDRFIPRWGTPYSYSLFCDGPTDDSATYSGPEDADCPCCYLGMSHSQALHDHYLSNSQKMRI